MLSFCDDIVKLVFSSSFFDQFLIFCFFFFEIDRWRRHNRWFLIKFRARNRRQSWFAHSVDETDGTLSVSLEMTLLVSLEDHRATSVRRFDR